VDPCSVWTLLGSARVLIYSRGLYCTPCLPLKHPSSPLPQPPRPLLLTSLWTVAMLALQLQAKKDTLAFTQSHPYKALDAS
jgi:hypothetical protein